MTKGEHPSEWLIETTDDDGRTFSLPYCTEALMHFLMAHGIYGIDAGVIEVKITRRSAA